MELSKEHAKLVAKLLEMASDEFGSHGCNDFNLAEVMPSVEDRQALVRAMYEANGTPDEFDPDDDCSIWYDWWLMSYFSRMFESYANS